jgi:hypothetical protein
MLSSSLTVISNQGSITLPGAEGTKSFNQVAGGTGNQVLRRIAATATTTPQEILISHQNNGTGFGRRSRSVIKATLRKENIDPSTTGNITPSASCHLVIDRPLNMGSNITDAEIKTLLGQLMDVITRSGQLDALLNQEA